jgi:undecaprenyl-diphosphatase
LFIAVGVAVIILSFHFDEPVQRWLTAHRDHAMHSLMEQISRFGDWPAHIALGLTMLGLAYLRKSRTWMRIFLAMLIACALAGIVARGVKIGAGRARPSVHADSAWNGPRFAAKYHAFPSGHTAASAAFFGVLVFRRWRIGLPLLAIPMLIALSRMYVAAHFLSDVVCAFLLGLVCAWFTGWWMLGSAGESASKRRTPNVQHPTSN